MRRVVALLCALLWGLTSAAHAAPQPQRTVLFSGNACASVVVSLDFVNGAFCAKSASLSNPQSIPGWSFTRASIKTELTAANQVIVFAPGVPAITDLGFLPEGAIVQSLFNSTFGSISAGAPAAWTANAGGGTGVTSLYGSDSAAMTFTAAATRPFIGQVMTVAANTTYVVSALVEANPNGLAAQELVGGVVGPTGTTGTYPGGALAVPAVGTWVSEVLSVGATAGTITVRVGVGVNSAQTGTATLSRPQFEANAARSSYVPNASQVAVATRAADAASITGLSSYAASTLFVEFIQLAATNGIAASYDDATSNNRTQLGSNSGLVSAGAAAAGVTQFFSSWSTPVTGTTTQITKMAFAAASGDANVYANGSSVFSTSTFTVPTSTRLAIGMDRLNQTQLGGYVRRLSLYPSRQSNAQLQALTQ